MTPPRLVYEPCAGGASFTLALLGGRGVEPVAWMGSKRRLARHMLAMVGLRPGEGAGAFVLADPGPWGWVWPVLLQEDSRAEVVRVLRSWSGQDPRALWDSLAAQPPPEDLSARAAHWLWLQARAANAVPVWWEERSGTYRVNDHATGRSMTANQTGDEHRPERLLASDGRGDPCPAGQRGEGLRMSNGQGIIGPVGQKGDGDVGRAAGVQDPGTVAIRVQALGALVQGSGGLRRDLPQPAGQRNTDGGPTGRCKGIMDPGTVGRRLEGLAPHVERFLVLQSGNALGKPVGIRPDGRWNLAGWGHLSDSARAKGFRDRPSADSLAGKVARLPPSPPTLAVYHGSAEDLVLDGDHRDTVVLFDPPYRGRTGYGWDLPRERVLHLARAYVDAGAWVLLCEAEPLAEALGPGWEAHDLTPLCRRGGGPEWVTTSRPARARVSVQVHLPWEAAS